MTLVASPVLPRMKSPVQGAVAAQPLAADAFRGEGQICKAFFKKMDRYEVDRTRHAAEMIARRTNTDVDFKVNPGPYGRVELGVRFCGWEHDVQRAWHMLVGQTR